MAGKALYSRPVENIDNGLFEAYQRAVEHPRDMLDMLCVADLASWTAVPLGLVPIMCQIGRVVQAIGLAQLEQS